MNEKIYAKFSAGIPANLAARSPARKTMLAEVWIRFFLTELFGPGRPDRIVAADGQKLVRLRKRRQGKRLSRIRGCGNPVKNGDKTFRSCVGESAGLENRLPNRLPQRRPRSPDAPGW
ncbi:MAG: hypothetical protein AAGL24_23635 [Pseudomonadota bacterium]